MWQLQTASRFEAQGFGWHAGEEALAASADGLVWPLAHMLHTYSAVSRGPPQDEEQKELLAMGNKKRSNQQYLQMSMSGGLQSATREAGKSEFDRRFRQTRFRRFRADGVFSPDGATKCVIS